MRNLLNFLAKYNHVIVFILLESLALYLLFESDNYHNIKFYHKVRGITASAEKSISNYRYYWGLREINERLAMENTRLRDSLSMFTTGIDGGKRVISDSLINRKYTYQNAGIVNNSTNRQKNFITLDKGFKQGIEKDMAVISDEGVVGLIVASSNNYSVAMSLLNIDMKMSAKIKSNGYFGSLSWDGVNYRFAKLSEIPQHVPLNLGDTIVTSGFSSMFPEGIIIGFVSEFEKTGSDFYDIDVELAVDFKKIHFVDVVTNQEILEQQILEFSFQ